MISTITDIYWPEQIDSNIWISWRILLVFFCIVTEIFGCGLCLGICIYEKIGGDPQKRNIMNQLISGGCFSLILCNLSVTSTMIARLISGPLNVTLAWCLFFVPRAAFTIVGMLSLDELLIFRFLTIYV